MKHASTRLSPHASKRAVESRKRIYGLSPLQYQQFTVGCFQYAAKPFPGSNQVSSNSMIDEIQANIIGLMTVT